MKRILALVLAMFCAFGALVEMPVMAYATSTSIAKKTSTAVDEAGRFEVEIQVPGDDGREYHDEVIVMVDGSYSTDDDWSTTRAAIVEIGKTVLEGSGNTLLTVMTFGMGDNIVLKHVASVAELEATLTELPGGLLYGRSSTNCEAGFTGIAEYIGSHDGTLNEVHVVYITDGEINTDETEYVFYNWTQNTWLKRDALTLVRWAIEEEWAYYEAGEANLSNAYLTVFGDPNDIAEQALIEEEEDLEEEEVIEDETSEEEEEVVEDETSKEEEEAVEDETSKEEEEAVEDETSKEEEEVVEDETSKEEEEAVEDETSKEEEEVVEDETSKEEEEVVEDEISKEEEEVVEDEISKEEEVVVEDGIPEEWEFVTEEDISVEQLSSNGTYKVQLLSATSTISDENTSDDGVISDEEAMAWADQVWKDVYAYSGMTPESAYTVSDAERAFVRYDKENGTHIQEMFYYALWGRSYPDRFTRTPAAGLALAANGKVAHLYMVDSNGATSWMSGMASSASNVSFYEAGSVSNLLTALEGVLTNLAYTPYNDVVVTDYMSKWVNLDTTTIKIVDNYSGATIWTNTEGWLISENMPTSQDTPVYIEEVPTDAYAEGGSNVVGNENGTIYKLTWYVRDGAMLRNHNYSLVYEVDVDTKETGFKYNTNYPANGNTTIEYTEKNGDETTDVTEEISVPNVIVNRVETVTISGTKTWEDEDNKHGKRPESITVNLMADGTKVDSKVVTAEDNWSYSFEDVAKYTAEGDEIMYTVSEDEVAEYETTINGYNITNTYVKPEPPAPETVDIIGTKTWKDEDNKYGKRPESITVNLMTDGTKVDSKVVTAEDNWSYSFENVPKYNAEGKEIVYTVSENKVDNYKTTVTGYDITNTYVKETVNVSGTKTWKDNNDKYGKRPDSITVNLLANGTKVASKVVTAEDNWNYSFKNLPKYDSEGKEYVYTVTENKVASYTTRINGYNIVNTYKKPSIFRPSFGDNPKTGDYIGFAVATAIISAGALIILFRIKKKKNRK